MQTETVRSRLSKLFSIGSTNPQPIGEVNITSRDGERESFEAKLLKHTEPHTRSIGRKSVTSINLLLDYDDERIHVCVPTRTVVGGRVVGRQAFHSVLKESLEFHGFIIMGTGTLNRVKGTVKLYE